METLTRTQRKLERQSRRNIIISLVVLVVLIILFFLYGIQMLINLSLYLEKLNSGKNVTANSDNTSFIAPPMINPMSTATNSAQIIVSGYALPAYTVKLYVNDHLAGSEQISDDKSFSFPHVSLVEGQNDIKAKTVTQDGKESEYSDDLKISYMNKAPALNVSTPSDGQTFSNGDNPIKVTGSTDPGVKITINDYWAIVDDQGKFSYILPLQKGDTHLKIAATDNAGNQTTKELKVTLNQ